MADINLKRLKFIFLGLNEYKTEIALSRFKIFFFKINIMPKIN